MGSLSNQIIYSRNDVSLEPIIFSTRNGCLFGIGSTDMLRVGEDSADYRIVASQPVILYGNPACSLEATPKQYVDIRRICYFSTSPHGGVDEWATAKLSSNLWI
jgi:hypothetical protein